MNIPSELFSTELFWSAFKWVIIAVIWGIFAFGMWREDRNIRRLLAKPMSETDAVTLLATLHRRDMHIWLQLSLLLIVVATNDINQGVALLPPDLFAVAAPPVQSLPVKPAPDDMYDKILKRSALPGLPFSTITEFNEKNGKTEAYVDWLKERYESWFITYYYLQKCKVVSPDDYALIRKSLSRDLESAHASAAIADNILLASNGSYKEMYSDIPCDKASISATKSAYDANMQQAGAQPQAEQPQKTGPQTLPAKVPPAPTR